MAKLLGMAKDELDASKPTLQPLVYDMDKLNVGVLVALLNGIFAPQVSFLTFVSPPCAALLS